MSGKIKSSLTKHLLRKLLCATLIAAQIILLCPQSFIESRAASAKEPDYTVYRDADGNKLFFNKRYDVEFHYPSFVEMGDPNKKKDGKDLSDVMHYTDDYFKESAINRNVTEGSVDWTQLDNLPLASASLCLAMSAFASNIDNYNASLKRPDYSNKFRNGEDLLKKIGFTNLYHNDWFTVKPEKDSIGVIIGEKEISFGGNDNYVLRAVAVRGAGYESEWASNLTIGLSSEGHVGFNDAAKKAFAEVKKYHNSHPVEEGVKVKYWVVGYSRAGATANLLSGLITDNAAELGTSKRNVYGYTFEAPQGAQRQGNESTLQLKYRNIHNIINQLDLVPKVSPWQFGHQRLGIDYILPYYKNTSSDEYKNYKANMLASLSKDSGCEELVKKYPDEGPIDIYTFNLNVLADRVEKRDGSKRMGDLGGTVYMDTFIDKLLDKVTHSPAWGTQVATWFVTPTIDDVKAYYVKDYQEDLRSLVTWVMSGKAGSRGWFITGIAGLLGLGGFATGFALNPVVAATIAAEISSVCAQPKWLQAILYPGRLALYGTITSALAPFLSVYVSPPIMVSAVHLIPVFVELFLNDRSQQYQNFTGTAAHYMWDLFTTHIPEVTLAWMKSLDDSYADFRTRPDVTKLSIDARDVQEITFYKKDSEIPFAVFANNNIMTNDAGIKCYGDSTGKLDICYTYKDVKVKYTTKHEEYKKITFDAQTKTKSLPEEYKAPYLCKGDVIEMTQTDNGDFKLKKVLQHVIEVEGVADTESRNNYNQFLNDITAFHYDDNVKTELQLTLAGNDEYKFKVTGKADFNLPLINSSSNAIGGKPYYASSYSYKRAGTNKEIDGGKLATAGFFSIDQTGKNYKEAVSTVYTLKFTEAKNVKQNITVLNGAKLFYAKADDKHKAGQEVEYVSTTRDFGGDYLSKSRTTYEVEVGTEVIALPNARWISDECMFNCWKWGTGQGSFFEATGTSSNDYVLNFKVPYSRGGGFTLSTMVGEKAIGYVKEVRLENSAIKGTENIATHDLWNAGIMRQSDGSYYLGGTLNDQVINFGKETPKYITLINNWKKAEGDAGKYQYTGWDSTYSDNLNFNVVKKQDHTSDTKGEIDKASQEFHFSLGSDGKYVKVAPSMTEITNTLVLFNGEATINGKTYSFKNNGEVPVGIGKQATVKATKISAADLINKDIEGMSQAEIDAELKKNNIDINGYQFDRWTVTDDNGNDVTNLWMAEADRTKAEGVKLTGPAFADNEKPKTYYLMADYANKSQTISTDHGLIAVRDSQGEEVFYGSDEEVKLNYGDSVTLNAGTRSFKATLNTDGMNDDEIFVARHDLTDSAWSFEYDSDRYFSDWLVKKESDRFAADIPSENLGTIDKKQAVQTFTMPNYDGKMYFVQQSTTTVPKLYNLTLSTEFEDDIVYFRAQGSQPLYDTAAVPQASNIQLYAPEKLGDMIFSSWNAYTVDEYGDTRPVYLVNFNTSDPNASFTMPNEDLTITPVYLYEDEYVNVVVVNGKLTNDSMQCHPGETIGVAANKENGNESFLGWESSDDGVLFNTPNSTNSIVILPKDCSGKTITITATYAQASYVVKSINSLPIQFAAPNTAAEDIKKALNNVSTVDVKLVSINDPDAISIGTVPIDWNLDLINRYGNAQEMAGDKTDFTITGRIIPQMGLVENESKVFKMDENISKTVVLRFVLTGMGKDCKVQVSREEGVYKEPISVVLSVPDGYEGLYTVDGSQIDRNDTEHTFRFNGTATVNFKGKAGIKTTYTLRTDTYKFENDVNYYGFNITYCFVIDRTAEQNYARNFTLKDENGKVLKTKKTTPGTYITFNSEDIEDVKDTAIYAPWKWVYTWTDENGEKQSNTILGKGFGFRMPNSDVEATLYKKKKVLGAILDLDITNYENNATKAGEITYVLTDYNGKTVLTQPKKAEFKWFNTGCIDINMDLNEGVVLLDPNSEYEPIFPARREFLSATDVQMYWKQGNQVVPIPKDRIYYGGTNYRGSVYFSLIYNPKEQLKAVPVFSGEKIVKNGTSLDDILPKTIDVALVSGKKMTINTPAADWSLKTTSMDENYTYDPDNNLSQKFVAVINLKSKIEAGSVGGTQVNIPDNISTEYKMSIFVEEKPVAAAVYSLLPQSKADDVIQVVYNNPINVKLATPTKNVNIYYTVTEDGSEPKDPTNTDNLYDADTGLNLSGEPGATKLYNIKARAKGDGYADSVVTSFIYKVTLALNNPEEHEVFYKAYGTDDVYESVTTAYAGEYVVINGSTIANAGKDWSSWNSIKDSTGKAIECIDGLDSSKRVIRFLMPNDDVYLDATFTDGISEDTDDTKIEIFMNEPEPDTAADSDLSIKLNISKWKNNEGWIVNDSYTQTGSITWNIGDSKVKFGCLRYYLDLPLSSNIQAALEGIVSKQTNGSPENLIIYLNNDNGNRSYVTVKDGVYHLIINIDPILNSINGFEPIAPVTLKHGTYQEVMDQLNEDESIFAVAKSAEGTKAIVDVPVVYWAVEGKEYDPSNLEQQEIILVPDINANESNFDKGYTLKGVDLTKLPKKTVTVSAAPKSEAVTATLEYEKNIPYIRLNAAEGAKIYYTITIDGKEPANPEIKDINLYNGSGIRISESSENVRVKAIAVEDLKFQSDVAEHKFSNVIAWYEMSVNAYNPYFEEAVKFSVYNSEEDELLSGYTEAVASNDNVTVWAPEPEEGGYEFEKWEVKGLTLSADALKSAELKFKMPATDIELTALYKPAVEDIVLTLMEIEPTKVLPDYIKNMTFTMAGTTWELDSSNISLEWTPDDDKAEFATGYSVEAKLDWDTDADDNKYFNIREVQINEDGSITPLGAWDSYEEFNVPAGINARVKIYDEDERTYGILDDYGWGNIERTQDGGVKITYGYKLTKEKDPGYVPTEQEILNDYINYDNETFADDGGIYELYIPAKDEVIPTDAAALAKAQEKWIPLESTNRSLYELPGRSFYVRSCETTTTKAGSWVKITLSSRPEAISASDFELDYENESVSLKELTTGIQQWQYALESADFNPTNDTPDFYSDSIVDSDEDLYLDEADYDDEASKLVLRKAANYENHVFASNITEESIIAIPARPEKPVILSITDDSSTRMGTLKGQLKDVTKESRIRIQYQEKDSTDWTETFITEDTDATGNFVISGIHVSPVRFRICYNANNEESVLSSKWSDATEFITVANTSSLIEKEITVKDKASGNELVSPVNKTYGDDDFIITCSVDEETGANSKFSYSSSAPSIVKITSTDTEGEAKVNILSAGVAKITVNYESDGNFGKKELTINVVKKPVTITGLSASNKAYDGTVAAEATGTAVVSGILEADRGKVSVKEGYAVFADAAAGINKTVSFREYGLTGERAVNYSLSSQPADVLANITKGTLAEAIEISSVQSYDAKSISVSIPEEFYEDMGTTTYTAGTASVTNGYGGKGTAVVTDFKVDSEGTVTANISATLDAVDEIIVLPVTITSAYYEDISCTISIRLVNKFPANIAFTDKAETVTSYTKTYGDTGFTVTPVVTTETDYAVNNGKYTFTSSNASVARIDKETGAVTIMKPGTTNIKVQYEDANLIGTGTIVLTINPKTVYVYGTAVEDKIYDGTTAAEIKSAGNVKGLVGSDNVTVKATGTVTFKDKNVGEEKDIDISGLTFALEGSDSYKYVLGTYAEGETPEAAKGKITSKPVTVTITAKDRPYETNKKDVELDADKAVITGVLEADAGKVTLDVSKAVALIEDPKVGEGKNVTVRGIALTGEEAANYAVAQPENLKVNILKGIAPTLSDVTSRQAFTTNLITTSVAGLMPNDAENITYKKGTASVVDNDNKPVDADNIIASYEVSDSGQVTVTLISGIDGLKVIVPVIIGTDNYNDATVNAVITLLDKTDAGVTASLSTGDADVVYGMSGIKLNSQAATTGNNGKWTYASSNTDTALIDQSGNITIVNAGISVISAIYESDTSYGEAYIEFSAAPKPITLVQAVNSKVYDGTANATLNGKPTIERAYTDTESDIYLVEGTASFEDKNAGSQKTVTFSGYSLAGTKAANYVLTDQPAAQKADIARKDVTAEFTIESRDFQKDNLAVTIKNAVLNGTLAGDQVSIDTTNAKALMKDANAGEKAVSIEGAVLTGDDKKNYRLVEPLTSTVTINKLRYSGDTYYEFDRTFLGGAKGYDTIDLAAYIPGDYGSLTFNINGFSPSSDMFVKAPVIEDGTKLKYTVAESGSSKTETVRVVAALMNYTDFVFTVHITRADLGLFIKTDEGAVETSNWQLYVGEDIDIIPVFSTNDINQNVVLTSSNPNVATVNQNGNIKANTVGTTTITAISEYADSAGKNYTAKMTITVTEATTKLSFEESSYDVGVGEEILIVPDILPYDAMQKVEWFISNEAIAKMSVEEDTSSAVITGLQKGTAKVTIKAVDGSDKTASCTIHVGNPVGDFTVEAKGKAKAVAVDKSLKMLIKWTETTPQNKDIIWEVEDEYGDDGSYIAKISDDGTLTGVTEGRVTVIATSEGNSSKMAFADIDVYVPVKSASLNITSGSIAQDKANTLQLSATVTSAAEGLEVTGTEIDTDPDIIWAIDSSSKYASFLAVDENGLVSLTEEGRKDAATGKTVPVKATIKAFAGYEKTLVCKVKIVKSQTLSAVTLSEKSLTLSVNSAKSVNISLNPTNFADAVTYAATSSKTNIATASITDGVLTVEGKAKGSAVITVTATSGSVTRKTTLKVSVKAPVSKISFKNKNFAKTEDGSYAALLKLGKKIKVSTAVEPNGAISANGLTWVSTNPSVASVNSNGQVTGIMDGYAVIYAIAPDGSTSCALNITVYEPVQSVKIDKSKLTLASNSDNRIGKVYISGMGPDYATFKTIEFKVPKNKDNIKIMAVDANDIVLTNDFMSEDEDYTDAIVSNGQALAIYADKPGVVTIKGTTIDGTKKTVKCKVTVLGEITNMTVAEKKTKNGLNGIENNETVMKAGSSQTIKPVYEINGVAPSNKKVYAAYKKYTKLGCAYRSSNTSVATVSKTGKITVNKTAKSGDTANIYITSHDGKFTTVITVKVK
ncbi:YDG domain-containing protein [Butyrivibrio sp. MC2021]|uniref:YDG domain-containing protein n=1 Tax=Butyrivibrio sp. MC2021 TaxID=1408306 RepID=UPI00047E0E1C|nr:YDG domain-containing protein [Butyrivibrio sp. MC2021]